VPLGSWRQGRAKILVEKKQALTRACPASQSTLQLDEILQAPFLAELLLMEHPIKIDQIKLPVCIPVVFDQQIGVAHISSVQPRGMERAQKLGQRLQKCPPLAACPVLLLVSPVHVEGHLSLERFTAIPTLSQDPGHALLEGCQGPGHKESSCLQ
jgi:hypothetical protein